MCGERKRRVWEEEEACMEREACRERERRVGRVRGVLGEKEACHLLIVTFSWSFSSFSFLPPTHLGKTTETL